jgi:hypothetical protein
MFDQWWQDSEYPTLYRVERDVIVDVSRAFPGAGHVRQDELPLWVKTSALRFEPSMRARQVAWIRRASDGGWLAVVLMSAGSANGKSTVTMQLWLEPEMISIDLAGHVADQDRQE